MRQYELVGIVRPDLEPDAVQAVVERIGRRVAEAGGTVDVVDVWGKRRLAYAIGRYREGIYFLLRFTVPKEAVPELKRLTRIMDEVMRALIVVAEGPLPTPKAAPERGTEPARAGEPARVGEPGRAGAGRGTEPSRAAETAGPAGEAVRPPA